MNKSKNIFEKIRMYFINKKRKKKEENLLKKEEIKENNNQKKHSKIKNLFKFIIGFFTSIIEYFVLKSNKKNNTINRVEKKQETVFFDNEKKNDSKEKEVVLKQTIEINNIESIEKKQNLENEIKEQNTKKDELIEKKNELIIIENEIIDLTTKEELDYSKMKILKIKSDLQIKKIKNKKEIDNNNYQNDTNNFQNDNQKQNEVSEEIIQVNEKKEEINTENETKVNEINDIKENNDLTIDELIKRCDEDLELIEEKENYLKINDEYDKQLEDLEKKEEKFKITKKDLNLMKKKIALTLEKQKQNLEQINKKLKTKSTLKVSLVSTNNFFKNTTKLSFSFLPFFLFPNKLVGLTTSLVMFNNSLKNFKHRTHYLKFDYSEIKKMINDGENCLRVGINSCDDSLSEIQNIKYYLSSLPSNVKDSIEYRKYLLDVTETERLVEKQKNSLKNMSIKYSDTKIKIKIKKTNKHNYY